MCVGVGGWRESGELDTHGEEVAEGGRGGAFFVTLLTSFIHPAGFNEEEAAEVFHEVDKDGWVGGWVEVGGSGG